MSYPNKAETVLTAGHLYRTLDAIPEADLKRLGSTDPHGADVYALWDGMTRRKIKAGEWFLSGALIAAYRAHQDLGDQTYYRARLVRTELIPARRVVVQS